jgi:hypothetical protein
VSGSWIAGGAPGRRPRLHAAPLVQSARGHPAGPERVERLADSSSPGASPKRGSVVIRTYGSWESDG